MEGNSCNEMLTSLIRFHLKKLKSEDQFQVKSNTKEIMSSKIEKDGEKKDRDRARNTEKQTQKERERRTQIFST